MIVCAHQGSSKTFLCRVVFTPLKYPGRSKSLIFNGITTPAARQQALYQVFSFCAKMDRIVFSILTYLQFEFELIKKAVSRELSNFPAFKMSMFLLEGKIFYLVFLKSSPGKIGLAHKLRIDKAIFNSRW